MSLTDVLIILGCLAGGYWIVSSVMGPGIDITRRKPPAASEEHPHDPPSARTPPPARLPPPARNTPRPVTASRPPSQPRASSRTESGVNDWRIILDVPNTASRSDIETAFRHQQKKAQAAGDTILLQRLQQARDAGLAALKSGGD
jgi:hypothetical protein